MIKILKIIIYEPLFHFFLIGLVLYPFINIMQENKTSEQKIITVSKQEIQKLKDDYKQYYNENLIQKLYLQKILLNEAYLLGIYKQDDTISKILVQKMQYLISDSSKINEPNEDMLKNYYLKNIKDYSYIDSLSFYYIEFTEDDKEKINDILYSLKLSNHIPPFAKRINNASINKINDKFGRYFTTKIIKLKENIWHKKIYSKGKYYLINIINKKTSKPYRFDDIQNIVYNDYMYDLIKTQKDNNFKKLQLNYKLEIK